MDTAANLFKYLQKQGTSRVRPLFLLLQNAKSNFISLVDLTTQHQEVFHKPLHSWNLHVLHRENLIDFRRIRLNHWTQIGDFIQGRLFDISPEYVSIYRNDKIRIKPAMFPVLKETQEYLLFRSFFYSNPRPMILYMDPQLQPLDSLLRVVLPLYQFYDTKVTITSSQICRLVNNGLFNEWSTPLTESQIRSALLLLMKASTKDFQISIKAVDQFELVFHNGEREE